MYARGGEPIDPTFVFPEPKAGAVDILWECDTCDIQEMEFNMAPGLARMPPTTWESIDDQLDEEEGAHTTHCPWCKNLFKWM